MDKPSAGLRKRQQITRANQMMFLWIAGVSVVVGFSLVLMIFLAQRIWFGEKVIAEKEKTVATLEKNIKVVDELKNNVRVLNTDINLLSTRQSDNDSALQSILDALPADANSTAMASSLQTKLLNGVNGVTIESIKVDPVVGLETATASRTSTTRGASTNTIGFSFSVSAPSNSSDGLRQVLLNIEKSIRPFNITNLAVEVQGARIVMTGTGVGYYYLAQDVQTTAKAVRP